MMSQIIRLQRKDQFRAIAEEGEQTSYALQEEVLEHQPALCA